MDNKFNFWFQNQNHGISFGSKEYKLAKIIWDEVEALFNEVKELKKEVRALKKSKKGGKIEK